MTEDTMQSPGHRVTAAGAASRSLGMQRVISCHGHGHCHHLTGSPLSPLTSFIIHQSHKPFYCPFRRQKMGCTISQGRFLSCRRAHSYAPVIIGHVHTMNGSSQAHNILQGARYHPGGVAHGLLPWVFPANCLHKTTILC